MGQVYNRSKMDNLQDIMVREVDLFVKALQLKTACSNVELATACRALEADIICELTLSSPSNTHTVPTLFPKARFSFGVSIGAMKAWAAGQPLRMIVNNDEKAKWMPVVSDFSCFERIMALIKAKLVSFPGLVAWLEWLERTIFTMWGWQSSYTASMEEWEAWADEGLARVLPPTEHQGCISSPNLIQTLLNSGLHPQAALCEARENIGPGTDTTSATMAHILFALANNPEYQATLRHELEVLNFPTDMTSLESIPKLRACVKEGIRWTGAAAAMLPRIVPDGGVWLSGKFLPAGVWHFISRISCKYLSLTIFCTRRSSHLRRSGTCMIEMRSQTRHTLIHFDG